MPNNSKNVLIVGGDAAGMSAASKVKRMRPDWSVQVIEKGKYISYASCGIPYFIAGIIGDERKLSVLTPETAREKRGIDVLTMHEAVSIFPSRRTVSVIDLSTDEHKTFHYDRLMIATGAKSVVPKIDGMDLNGVFTLRNLSDGIRIREFLDTQKPDRVVIVGAGYIGLEMAEAFRARGMSVTIIEMMNQVMPTVDPDMSEIITEELKRNEVNVHLFAKVKKITGDKSGSVTGVQTDSGTIDAGMVLLAVGVRPNSDLARDAGIKLGETGAISVNNRMKTDAPNIYAAGDCVEYRHMVSGKPVYIPLAPAANKGGKTAGENMAGKVSRFPGILGTSVAKVFDLEIAGTGLREADALDAGFSPKSSTITGESRAKYYPGAEPIHVKITYDEGTRRVLGGQIIGKDGVSKRIDIIGMAAATRMTIDELAQMDLAYAPPFSPVYDPVNIAAAVAK